MGKYKSFFSLILLSLIIAFLSMVIVNASEVNAQLDGSADDASAIYRGVSTAVQFDVSPPLRSMQAAEVDPAAITEIPDRDTGLEGPLGPQDQDPLVQTSIGAGGIPAPLVSFNGPPNVAGVSPPDPVGDVGPNHYVAMSNLYFAVYDKTGTVLLGPSPNNTLWSGFGGDCQTDNSGDPIVIYDQLADRWILTQFTASGPTYFNCVAISTSPDPTSTYYRYAFSTGSNFPDYPKYGVWPDALYISTREFAGGTTFAGMGAYAIDRADLIAGNPAPTVISFLATAASAGGAFNIGDGLLPTDLDGSTLPPAGTPNFFVGSMDDGGQYGAPQDALTIWEFQADFVTPANSTFTLENTVPVAAFDSQFPCTPGARSCIPQPGTANKVDILSYRQRPMWRLAYRNFGSHESLVTNQSVEASTGIAGIRWYEIRDPDGTPTIYQQGTYAPGTTDGIHRWMGSIAMDGSGNMALGYSASDATSTFPSVWYTGRLASDPLGQMPQGEGSIIDGTGSQTGSQRWGDYTSMNVDPVDDCTFWYVNEYVPVSSSVGWQLRIGAFKFDQCSAPVVEYCSTTPIAIPDNDPAGITQDIVIADSGNITDLDISLDVTHTWVGDLVFTVTHQATGTSVTIVDQPGLPNINASFGCNDNNFDNFILDDDSANGPHDDACPNTDATPAYPADSDWDPIQALSAFDGEDLSGTWTITASDNAGGDTGTLDQWCLIPTADMGGQSIVFTKTVGLDPGSCASSNVLNLPYGGDAVTYCYEVTNTGTVTLTEHDLVDSELGTLLSGFAYDLTPGSSVWITASTMITQTTVNLATWTAGDGVDTVSQDSSATVNVAPPEPMIAVNPSQLTSAQAPDNQVGKTLTISNIGTGDLDWSITETVSIASLPQPAAASSKPQPTAMVEVVTGPEQCAAYENYAGAEPAGYAEFCVQSVPEPWVSENFDPTDTAFAQDIGFVSDNFVSHALNDFTGQAVIGPNAQPIFAMDFDQTGTILYAIDNTSRELGTYNLATGAFTAIAAVSGITVTENISGLTIDPATGTAYVSGIGTGLTLYTMDLTTAVATTIGSDATVTLMIDIAIGPQGIIYGHDIGTDSIYTIDKNTGVATLVGLTGVDSNFAQGMDFDNVDGTLYAYTYQGGGANQYGTINLATGALTPLAISSPQGEFEGATMTAGTPACGGGIPWASVAPSSGTTSGGNSTDVIVTFDSTGLTIGNTYTGTLCVNSNDAANPIVTVPLTLTVEAPSYGVELDPDGAMTDLAGATVTYTLYITNTGNTADTFNLAATGNSWTTTLSDSSVSLNVGESTMVWVTVDIPTGGVADGDMDVATVTATSAGDSGVSASATLTTTAEVEGYFIYLPFVARSDS